MESWIEELGRRHRELARQGWLGKGALWQKEQFWLEFVESCQAATRAYSQWFGGAVFVVEQPPVERRRVCNIAEYNPDNPLAVITFDDLNGAIEVMDTVRGRTAAFKMVLDPRNALGVDYRGHFLDSNDAARAALAPVLFGLDAYYSNADARPATMARQE